MEHGRNQRTRGQGNVARADRTADTVSERATDDGSETVDECHRRGCSERATFLVRERYLEETGQGLVEATAALCLPHTAEESPTNLEAATNDYVFRVDPISAVEETDADR